MKQFDSKQCDVRKVDEQIPLLMLAATRVLAARAKVIFLVGPCVEAC